MLSWSIPKIWQDDECWIIGGGPSLFREFNVPPTLIDEVISGKKPSSDYSQYLVAIHNKHVIGVNNAYQLGNWIDVLFFGDYSWYFPFHQPTVDVFPGIKVSCANKFGVRDQSRYNGLKYIRLAKEKLGISLEVPDEIRWNYNSGAAAINLAAQFGAKRIVLVGFDMDFDISIPNVTHWHGKHRHIEYGKNPQQDQIKRKSTFSKKFIQFLSCFPQIAEDAEKYNIEIINASLNSKIVCFKKASVKDLL